MKRVQVITMGLSDHNMIIGERMMKGSVTQQPYTEKRCYKKFKDQEYMTKLWEKKWLDIYLCEDVEKAVNLFTKNITELLDQQDVAPVKKIQNRKNYCHGFQMRQKT